ncbi:MAG TPA: hypothetical protein VHV75_05815 [Solirubrobacteraceae bacterium]|jgi:predicted acylesterase/phospholipase RssA|nr:hypothetical protein [Solirubrobacteraceae bacterium]
MTPAEIDACCYEEWVRRNPVGDYRLPRVSLLRGESDGEGPIIAVDVSEPAVRALPPGIEPEIPSLTETLFRLMLLSESNDARRRSFADVIIRPDFESIGIIEFHMLDRMRAAGREAATAALAEAPASIWG